jgi:putative ABC transport system permease protein
VEPNWAAVFSLNGRPLGNARPARSITTLAGVGIGSVSAIGATYIVSSLLYGFSGFDPSVLIGACLLLVLLALIASYLPARRATALDPVVALRQR